MKFGPLELQIFVSLSVVLGIALVALIVDYLKAVNENLRESNVELRVREEERTRATHGAGRIRATQRHSEPQTQVNNSVSAGAIVFHVHRDPIASEIPVAKETVSVEPAEAPAAYLPEPSRAVSVTPAQEIWPKPEDLQGAPEIPPARELRVGGGDIPENVVVVKPVKQPAEIPATSRPLEIVPEVEPEPAQDLLKLNLLLEPVRELPPALEVPAISEIVPAFEAALPDTQSLWDPNELISLPEPPAAEEPAPADVACPEECAETRPPGPVLVERTPEPVSGPLEFPAGMHNREVLQRLLDHPGGLVSGLVTTIGINDYEHLQASRGQASCEQLMRSVSGLLESILGDKGFGVRWKPDEFVLVFSGASGASGQRLLTQISERLWDFQLRSLASMSILFSWGAVDVTSEPLVNALAAANERMCQTKRTRNSKTDSQGSRKRAMVV